MILSMDGKNTIFSIMKFLKSIFLLNVCMFTVFMCDINTVFAVSCPAGQYAYLSWCHGCTAGCYCIGTKDYQGHGYLYSCNTEKQTVKFGAYTLDNGTHGAYACPASYPNSESESTSASNCYLTTTAGKYVSTANSAPVSCPAGYYCPGNVKINYGSTGGQTVCPAGTFASRGASSCAKCPAGQYSAAGASSCTKCPAGTYSAAGASSCTKCPAGTYASKPGNSKCSSCPRLTSGYIYDSTTGLTSLGQCKEYLKAGLLALKNCSDGTLTKSANTETTWMSATGAETIKAKAGYKVSGDGDGTSCVACGKGYYSIGGETTCTKCKQSKDDGWSETTTDSEKSTSITACYQTKTPTNCLSGTIKRNLTSSTNTEWSNPTVLEQLVAKNGYVVSGAGCLPCPDVPDGWEEISKDGSEGGTSWDYCQVKKSVTGCKGYLVKSAINANNYGEINSDNLSASAGHYKTGSGDHAKCEMCPSGKISEKDGATACTSCANGKATNTAHTKCISCSAGTYVDEETRLCSQCPSDGVNFDLYKYITQTGKTGTETCALQLKLSTDTNASNYNGKYSSCGAGTYVKYVYSADKNNYVSSGNQTINTSGTSIEVKDGGSLSKDWCKECPSGQYNIGGYCKECAKGSCITGSDDSSYKCELCPKGKYCKITEGTVIKCDDAGFCPKNTYSPGGLDTCYSCPVGYITKTDKEGDIGAEDVEQCVLAPFVLQIGIKNKYTFPMLKGLSLNSSAIEVKKNRPYKH